MLFPISDDDRHLLRPAYVTITLLVLNVLLFLQLKQFVSLGGTQGATGGVAYAAHIGGFIAGVVAGIIARVLLREEPETPFRRIYDEHLPRRRMR